MQEKINFIITDLNDYELTLKQLCMLMEKVLYYYSEKDINKFVHCVESFMIYFYMLYGLIQEAKGEKDE
jgi:hypothetical protein